MKIHETGHRPHPIHSPYFFPSEAGELSEASISRILPKVDNFTAISRFNRFAGNAVQRTNQHQ
jgi:hypothetical protein